MNQSPILLSSDVGLQAVYMGILKACEEISLHMRYHKSNKITSANEFGDVQLDMDVQTDSLIFQNLQDTGVVYAGLSEERPQMTYLNPEGEFIVTFDPLDGSSVIESNIAVGSIFAIWRRIKGKDDFEGRTGKEIVGAALSCYGSRTSILVFNEIHNRVDELSLQLKGEDYYWLDQTQGVNIRPQGRYFAPGNTKSIQKNKGYMECITFWARNGYTLRYSGGMAPDCYLLFAKGEGVFTSVSSEDVAPKLRVLYEILPIGFLVVKAGGMASNGKMPLMDMPIEGFVHKCDIIIGSIEEVQRCDRFLN